ncbi:MAG: LPXTG cell wall anchor domain-containing protein [bacterium]|nr:LPXTG cell wall anchor domain-containing protein [bacterium]
MNKKIIGGILIALILTLGLVVGDYLVKRQQTLEKKAAATPQTFTVEALLRSATGQETRFTAVNARAIVHYEVSPRVCYQGTHHGQCIGINAKNCMIGGYMSIPLRAGGAPCTGAPAGSYATKWDRKVVVGGQTYNLVYPTNCIGEQIDGIEVCEQLENITLSSDAHNAPYHRGIYQLAAVTASPTPTRLLPSPTPTAAALPTPTPTLGPTPTPTRSPTPTPTSTPTPTPTSIVRTSPTPTPLTQLPTTGSNATWIVSIAGAALMILGGVLVLAL